MVQTGKMLAEYREWGDVLTAGEGANVRELVPRFGGKNLLCHLTCNGRPAKPSMHNSTLRFGKTARSSGAHLYIGISYCY